MADWLRRKIVAWLLPEVAARLRDLSKRAG